MIPLLGALREDVPYINPTAFHDTIQHMVEKHIEYGRIHERDFLYFKTCSETSVFCDVGANIGASVLSFAAAGGRGSIHSFEINSALHGTLTDVATKLRTPWQLHKFGLSDEDKNVDLYVACVDGMYILGEATLRLDFLQEPLSIRRLSGYGHQGSILVGRLQVEVRRFDETGIIPTHVKIDAEGAEPFVLRGMLQTLREHKPLLMIESGAVEAVDAQLLPLGYRPYFFDEELNGLRIKTHDVQNVIYVHEARKLNEIIFED